MSIQKREITEELQDSYLSYAMSVIVSRALPDVRDGLKPVQRRILYAMHEMGLRHTAKHLKCARIVGDVLGNYHPHGDQAIYDTLVRMAQPFSYRYPLIDGQGNFGSLDGDAAAAYRYCLTGNSLLLTHRGIMPIKNISQKKEDLININILNYQGRLVKAAKFFNSGKHKIVEIITEHGYKLKGSFNHPVLCWAFNDFGFPILQWKVLKDISKNDYVVINRNFSLFNKGDLNLKQFYPKNVHYKNIGLPKIMNKDLAFLLGALVAEGSFHQNQILFNNHDMEFYSKVKNILESQFPGIKLYEREVKGNCRELSIYHQKAVKFLENLGLTNVRSDKKEIPFSILLSPKQYIRRFLIGLFEGDGSVIVINDKRHNGKSVHVVYDTKSQTLIEQLKVLLLNFGVITNFPSRDRRSDCYKLFITGARNIQQFAKEIAFFSERKNALLAGIADINCERMSKIDHIPFLNDYLRNNYKNEFIRKNNFDRYNKLEKNYRRIFNILKPSDRAMIDWVLKNRFLFDKIKFVNRLEAETVYSLRVNSKCHSFIANGFINHNTEARLTQISEEMCRDLDRETVNFIPNYDGRTKEPTVLPAALPQLLLNGGVGIAVGMATNIPPHNLAEAIDALVYFIDNSDATVDDLLQFIKGPDFPTGGIIFGKEAISEVYNSGRGSITMRGSVEIEERKNEHFNIIISEITYQTNKADFLAKIADLIQDKRIEGVKDARDESDKDGVRIVIELKSGVMPQKVLNCLYKFTDLQKDFHFNILALVDNGTQPQVLSLKDVLGEYLKHRKDIVKRRAQFDLKKAEERAHILFGLSRALRHIDAIIKTIKSSATKEEAHFKLIKSYKLSDIQVQAILEMKLQTLAGLERKKIEDEFSEKTRLISELKELLFSPKKITDLIKKELLELKEKYGKERKTKVVNSNVSEFKEEDLVPEEEVVITLSRDGYIKRFSPDIFKTQKRGGKGIIGFQSKEDDLVVHFLTANTHNNLLFFTSRGLFYQTKACEIPEAQRTSRGKLIHNFLNLQEGEKISAILSYATDNRQPTPKHPLSGGAAPKDKPTGQAGQAANNYLVMATKNGIIKKTAIDDFSSARRSGLIAIKLREDDNLQWVKFSSGEDEILLISSLGQAIRFSEKDVRPMSRIAAGVKAIKLSKDDELSGMEIISSAYDKKEGDLLIVMAGGFGKKTKLKEFKKQKRGGRGIKAAKITQKTGKAVFSKILTGEEEIVAISQQGQILKTSLSSIPRLGRSTQGVRIIKLETGDGLAGAVCL